MKKKYILAAAILAVSTTGFAQVKFGPQLTGGLATSSIREDPEVDYSTKSIAAFGIGVVAEIPLSEKISLRPSLSLLQKGGKLTAASADDGGIGSIDIKVDNKLYYAELPVLATFNVTMPNSKLFFGAGPSLGIGLFGKSKATYTINFPGLPPITETENADAFKKGEDEGAGMKRLDLSANVIAGMQWNNGFYVNAGYLHGFSNLQRDTDGTSYRNRSFQLSVGMMLGGK